MTWLSAILPAAPRPMWSPGSPLRLATNWRPPNYVVAAAIVSLLTILTMRETAGRSLSRGAPDEMFQSDADVRGARRPPCSDRVTVRAWRRRQTVHRGLS